MINMMHSMSKPSNQAERCLDSQLWYACAGGLAQIPPVNSKVYYFPQGHLENIAKNDLDFTKFPKIPSLVPCRVSSVKYLADAETDEVYAKIKLIPSSPNELDSDYYPSDAFARLDRTDDERDKSNSFAKTLTQSDANNGGGFSVPRYCAETLFPRLDYSAEPPVQTILVRDVHGEIWKFRHIYRGTPRRHLLTTGWSNFVNRKKLVAGDSVVFLRGDNGELCVGIRRAKTGIGGVIETLSNGGFGGRASLYHHHGFSGNNASESGKRTCDLGLSVESVVESANLACNGQPFEVVYCPRSSNPEFVVSASAVRDSMKVQWCQGMRFKMAFETEDSSRISWFMGTVSSVRVDDPTRWPDSPWKLLQVVWDEPDLLKNVKRVNPWSVELVPNNNIHLGPFHLPSKRPRIPQPPELSILGPCPMLAFPLSPISPLCRSPDTNTSGIQGPRHVIQMGVLPSENNLPSDKARTGLDLFEFGPNPSRKGDEAKEPTFFLFGCPILTERQILRSRCNEDPKKIVDNIRIGSFSDGEDRESSLKAALGFETIGQEQCKVFLESDDVGRTVDLSVIGSYEELLEKLTALFGVERANSGNVMYGDEASGGVKRIGEEPFGIFAKKVRRLTILTDTAAAEGSD